MKRCHECGREYDNTMMFCLDDGTELLYGPAKSEPGVVATGFPSDEPQTAILHSTAAPGEARTRAQIYTTEHTAILSTGAEAEPRESSGGVSEKHSFFANRAAKPVIAAVVAVAVLVGGFFGYKYLSPAKQVESIAVMPFVNESGNSDIEYLSDGMTETLIRSLSQLAGLQVKPRSSVFRYKGKETDARTIGKELNVQAILNGVVIQRGDQLTLNLELIDAQKDVLLWSEQYNRKQADLVSLQSEIAKDVSAKLTSKLSGADEAKVTKTSTADPEAYQAYLKGRFYWNRRSADNLQKAIEQFKIAIDRDPNYALAYAGLADAYVLVNFLAGTPPDESRRQARAYAERAIAIDDQLGEPHASQGLVYSQSWQWADAEREYKRAIELNPNYATAYHWYSIFLRSHGRFDEAALMIKRAQEIDPLSSIININVSLTYQIQNDHEASIKNTLKTIELDPTFSPAYEALGLSYLKQGRNAEAIASLEKAVELSKRENNNFSVLGYVYAATGKRTESIAIVKELDKRYARNESPARNIAQVYAGLGEKDKAFEWLEKGFSDKGNLSWISFEIPFESLRDDPRYKDLMKRMNLPE
jgi:TolB-like protein/Tfp pilus assembly protein PilF